MTNLVVKNLFLDPEENVWNYLFFNRLYLRKQFLLEENKEISHLDLHAMQENDGHHIEEIIDKGQGTIFPQ